MRFSRDSDARTHRTPKALRAKCTRRFIPFRVSFGSAMRPRIAFDVLHPIRAAIAFCGLSLKLRDAVAVRTISCAERG